MSIHPLYHTPAKRRAKSEPQPESVTVVVRKPSMPKRAEPCHHDPHHLRSEPGIVRCLNCGKVKAKRMNARWEVKR